MTRSQIQTAAYWVLTSLVALPMAAVGVAYLAQTPAIVDTFRHLGYPRYIVFILGPAKILGAIGIVQQRFSRLKEWAYAGYTFMFIGAIATHVFSGDPLRVAAAPAIVLALLVGSYALNRQREAADATAPSAVRFPVGHRAIPA